MITEKGNISHKYMAVAAVIAVVKKILNTTYPNQKKRKKNESQKIKIYKKIL